ncbi:MULTISPECIES: hypothetical protein [unclassified Psychrobacter]|uniref:hypothetical protein n=1 Tax=unclassified Psychrobacter TaxID=196806 RepID=UPI003FDAEEBA
MKTGISEIWNFGNEIPRSFGLVEVNSSNYARIKAAKRLDVIYHEITDTLLFGDNVVIINESVADDMTMYRENFLPAPRQQGDFNLFYSPIPPPIRPIKYEILPMM